MICTKNLYIALNLECLSPSDYRCSQSSNMQCPRFSCWTLNSVSTRVKTDLQLNLLSSLIICYKQ